MSVKAVLAVLERAQEFAVDTGYKGENLSQMAIDAAVEYLRSKARRQVKIHGSIQAAIEHLRENGARG